MAIFCFSSERLRALRAFVQSIGDNDSVSLRILKTALDICDHAVSCDDFLDDYIHDIIYDASKKAVGTNYELDIFERMQGIFQGVSDEKRANAIVDVAEALVRMRAKDPDE